MKLAIATFAAAMLAQTAFAGSLTPVYGGTAGQVVVKDPRCSAVMIGACGYCIGGVVYHM